MDDSEVPSDWVPASRDEGPPLLECYGGPWDGRRIVDQGSHFVVTADVPEKAPAQGSVKLHWRRLGIYKRRRNGYHWWPTRN